MRLKRLAAAVLSMVMLCSAPAYANEADAVAVYQEMEAKSKEMTDINAYYDFRIDVTDGTSSSGGRLEMNMKANNMTAPENMKCNMYMRLTMDGTEGAGPSVITGNIYMLDEMYYIDLLGQKIKYPMSLADMMKNVQATMGAMDTSLDYMENMTLRTEGEDRIISYTMNEGAMNDLVQKVLGMTGTPAGQEGMKMIYRDVSGEYVVNPEGYYTKARTKMAMDMTVGEMRLTMNIDGDVGVADPGQPVEVPVPNPEEYELMETASQ